MAYHRHLPEVDDRPGLIFMTAAFSFLVILTVILRFYARRLNEVPYGLDDWLAVVSLIFVLALNGIFLGGTIQGAITGHSPVVQDEPISTDLEHLVEKYKYAFQVTEKVTFGLIKLCILFLWKRIFGSSRKFATFCWVIIVIVIAWSTSFFFATIFQCGTDWDLNWAPILVFLTQCSNTLDMLTVFSVTDVVTDFAILLAPFPIIWKLHMPTRKKVGITSLLMIGLFTIGAGIARMYSYLATSYNRESNPDFIADFTIFMLWSEIEVNVAMMVSCMPTFVPVVRKCHDTLVYFSRSTGISKWSLLSNGRGASNRTKDETEMVSSSSMANLRHHQTGTKSTAAHTPVKGDVEAQLQGSNGILAHTEISNSLE